MRIERERRVEIANIDTDSRSIVIFCAASAPLRIIPIQGVSRAGRHLYLLQGVIVYRQNGIRPARTVLFIQGNEAFLRYPCRGDRKIACNIGTVNRDRSADGIIGIPLVCDRGPSDRNFNQSRQIIAGHRRQCCCIIAAENGAAATGKIKVGKTVRNRHLPVIVQRLRRTGVRDRTGIARFVHNRTILHTHKADLTALRHLRNGKCIGNRADPARRRKSISAGGNLRSRHRNFCRPRRCQGYLFVKQHRIRYGIARNRPAARGDDGIFHQSRSCSQGSRLIAERTNKPPYKRTCSQTATIGNIVPYGSRVGRNRLTGYA